MTILPTGWLCGLVLLGAEIRAAELDPTTADTDGRITVVLASGRRFTGELDRRTDALRLWLRWGAESSELLRPIEWDRVVEVRMGGRTLSGDLVRDAVTAVRKDVPLVAGDERPRLHAGPAPASPRTLLARREESRPVRSLDVRASLGRWSGGVESDGLVLAVYPLDEDGNLTPVYATIEVELIGQTADSPGPQGQFDGIGRWVEQVRPEDFGPQGAVYRLPFQGVHPEFDRQWSARGAVHAKLSVPGEGVFEATDATTRIRPYSVVRDRYEQSTGRRFFPNERTNRAQYGP